MKVLMKILAVVLALVLALVGVVYFVWQNELSTFFSIKEVYGRDDENEQGATYAINVKGDYYFDAFLAQGGISNDGDLIDFILKNITKGGCANEH